jgi:DNA-binding transcriptional regulator YiaG
MAQRGRDGPRGTVWDGYRVRALREHLGMTQRELADELGTRQQTVSEWETGAYTPRGTSSTLLGIIAERSRFRYHARAPERDGPRAP